jgi:hypothetical protein
VEAAGQLFHLFRDGLDYAFIRLAVEPERGVLFGSNTIRILVQAPARSISLSMSLYRAREVGLPAPLGVAT